MEPLFSKIAHSNEALPLILKLSVTTETSHASLQTLAQLIRWHIALPVLQNFIYNKHTKAMQRRSNNVACCADEQQVLFTLERSAPTHWPSC